MWLHVVDDLNLSQDINIYSDIDLMQSIYSGIALAKLKLDGRRQLVQSRGCFIRSSNGLSTFSRVTLCITRQQNTAYPLTPVTVLPVKTTLFAVVLVTLAPASGTQDAPLYTFDRRVTPSARQNLG